MRDMMMMMMMMMTTTTTTTTTMIGLKMRLQPGFFYVSSAVPLFVMC
jgi:hypothetical protein